MLTNSVGFSNKTISNLQNGLKRVLLKYHHLEKYDIEIFYFRPQFYPINNWDNEEFLKIKKTTETYKYKLGITSY